MCVLENKRMCVCAYIRKRRRNRFLCGHVGLNDLRMMEKGLRNNIFPTGPPTRRQTESGGSKRAQVRARKGPRVIFI